MKSNFFAVLVLFFILSFAKWVSPTATSICDVYRRRRRPQNSNAKGGDDEMFDLPVVANYTLPRQRYNKVGRNVSCPCDGDFVCLRKCCLREDSFNMTSKKCQRSLFNVENNFKPIDLGLPGTARGNYTIVYGLVCSSRSVKELVDLKLTDHGIAYIDNITVRPHEYCVDYFVDSKKLMVLRCDKTKILPVDFRVTLCFACSEFFLFLTFCVYVFVDRLMALLPNKILLCYIANLMTTYGIYIALQILNIHEGTFCIISSKYLWSSYLHQSEARK